MENEGSVSAIKDACKYAIVGSGSSVAEICDCLIKVTSEEDNENNPAERIFVFTDESQPPVDKEILYRLHLSKESEIDDDSVRRHCEDLLPDKKEYHSFDWYETHGIVMVTNVTIKTVNTEEKYIETQSGDKYTFDTLFYAAGTRNLSPQEAGLQQKVDCENTYTLQNFSDVNRLQKELKNREQTDKLSLTHIVIAGGGFMGLDIASSLSTWKPASVTVVEPAERLLKDILMPDQSDWLALQFQSSDIRFVFEASIVENDGSVSVKLSNGDRLACDIFIPAYGVMPNIELLQEAVSTHAVAEGEITRQFIEVDSDMQTSAAGVYAVGDICYLHEQQYKKFFDCSRDQSVIKAVSHAVGSINLALESDDLEVIPHYCGNYFQNSNNPVSLHMFGYNPGDSLIVPFRNSSEGRSPESFGAYWFREAPDEEAESMKPGGSESNSMFYVVGAIIINGTPNEIQAMKQVATKCPIIDRSQFQSLGVEFALDVSEDLSNLASANKTENWASEESPKSLGESKTNLLIDETISIPPSIIVNFGGRKIDVIASLKHVFRKFSHTTEPEMIIDKNELSKVTTGLDLQLNEEELAEAMCAFPNKDISYKEFEKWWIS